MHLKFDKKDKVEIFENAISWIVVFAMFVYGGAKLIQFKGAATLDKTVAEMTGMELMWAFYGYSQAFAITLGIFEILGGMLILFKKTRILGCLITSTILINVIFQDIYFEVLQGALRAAILYQLLILIIIWLNRQKLLQALEILLPSPKREESFAKLATKLGIAFILFLALRVGEYLITIKI
jgi:hypothetical protein